MNNLLEYFQFYSEYQDFEGWEIYKEQMKRDALNELDEYDSLRREYSIASFK